MRKSDAVHESVGKVEDRRPPRPRGDRDVIEAHGERALGVEGAAEAHAAVERKAVAALEQQANHLEEVLVPAHGDAVLGDAAESRHHAIVQRFGERRCIADRLEGDALAGHRDPRHLRRQRLDLQAVDADDGVAVVEQEMRQREPGRTHSDDQRPLAGRRQGQRLSEVQRIPARQQRVDLEAPRKRQHILEDPRLGLRNVDGIGLLVDARLHAVVADPVAGGRHQRVVDADDGKRTQRPAFGTKLVELGDLLLQRATGERHAERALLERVVGSGAVGRLLFEQSVRTRVLALLVAPDAVVRLVETGGEVHPRIGEREALPSPQVIAGELPRRHAVHFGRFERHQLHVVDLARRAEEHARLVQRAARRRVRGPCGIAQGQVQPAGVRRFVLLPRRHRPCKREFAAGTGHRCAEGGFEFAAERRAVERRRDIGLVRVHRLALDEEPLHRVQRRQRVMRRFERADLGGDAEERCQEILEMRGDGNQQCRLVLDGARRRIGAGSLEPPRELGVGAFQVRDEQLVDPGSARDGIELGVGEAVGELECRRR
jgi:hypothetical protein